MKNKKIIIIIFAIILLILIIFLIKNNYKISKKGNNISNKSADEIKQYILNIESYQAVAKITIKSNKNENIYIAKQQYNKNDNVYKQEILEPFNIAGIQFIYDGTNLRVENTKLNLNKIYKNYKYIGSNELSLTSFIENYQQDEDAKCTEENGTIILEVNVKKPNKYIASKKLYINKQQEKIEKMEINDITQNIQIYILYNEIEINKLPKEEILAFSIEAFKENI